MNIFESTTWDVAEEADKLYHSLFGGSAGLLKRKRTGDILELAQRKKCKKFEFEASKRISAKKQKKPESDQEEISFEKKRRVKVVSVEASAVAANKKQKRTETEKTSKETSVRMSVKEKSEIRETLQNGKSKVKRKKKRKRKCKKNKFKDNSKPEDAPAAVNIGHDCNKLLSVSDIPEIISDKFRNDGVPNEPDKTESEIQRKKKQHTLTELKQIAFDSNSDTQFLKKDSKTLQQLNGKKKTFSKQFKIKFDPQKLQEIMQKESNKDNKSGIGMEGTATLASVPGGHGKTKIKLEVPHNTTETLLEKSHRRLCAARFRYLNEQLYTRTGSEAFQLFQKDNEAFRVYHEGFQGQVGKWPVNPLDLIVDFIKSKPKRLLIADFGCGDGKLAQNVPNKVHSFDFVALNDHVTVCDMSKVPLKDSSIDIAVFCLSLMGTNLSSYLSEANRVLKHGGVLKIAEVSSRFHNIGSFVLKVEKMGFRVISQDNSSKMFVMMDFRKTGATKIPPEIRLDPCLYKKR